MKRFIPVIIILLTITSCKKLLDQKPTNFSDPENYFNTADQLNYARLGVYNQLTAGALYGSWANYLFAWEADIAYMNRTTLTTGPWNYFFGTADQYVSGFWANMYNGINRANVLIKNVDNNLGIPQATRDVVRGEALFLRGYYYFLLAAAYGGVPLKTTPTLSVVDVAIPRATLAETYAQVVKDMEASELLVPEITLVASPGTISKSAVRSILARVNLYMAGAPLNDKTRYAEARKWAKKVMDSGLHSLNPIYPQIFINLASDKYDAKETIWEAELWGNNTSTFLEAGNIGFINGPDCANTVTGRGDAYMSITSKYYDIYEPGDNRKWWNIAHFTYRPAPAESGAKAMTGIPTQLNKNVARPAKYRREYEVLIPKALTVTPQNFPIVRYSDVLLMFAEADNEVNNGPTQEAIDAINAVRQRGWSTGVRSIAITNGGSGYTTAPTVTFSSGSGSGVGFTTAAGTATIASGRVTGVTLLRDTTGITYNIDGKYTSAPTITFTGGGGTGATATATIFAKTDANLTATQTASKDAFLKAIQDERMKELNMEGLRKFDLIRWGIFVQTNQDVGNKILNEWPGGTSQAKYYTNVTNRDIYWPIPSAEMISNSAIVQNPGW